MEKERTLNYVEKTNPGDGEWRRIVSQKDERIVKDKLTLRTVLSTR
jgi:hypothetical protein